MQFSDRAEFCDRFLLKYVLSCGTNFIRHCWLNRFKKNAIAIFRTLRGTHRNSLLKETTWITFKDRRNDHKLIMMYKIVIVQNLVPTYLSELFVENVSSRSNRSLRANDSLIVPFARTERYKKSFLISSANLWNSLPITIRSCSSVASFKNRVIQRHNSITPNPLFYTGERLSAVLHTRLILCNSTLNHDLYFPSCSRGFPKQTVVHFFFECDRYAVIRDILLTSAAHLIGARWSNASVGTHLKWLLHGLPYISFESNVILFSMVQNFIIESGRFTHRGM